MQQAVDVDPYRTGGAGFRSARILLRCLRIRSNRYLARLKGPHQLSRWSGQRAVHLRAQRHARANAGNQRHADADASRSARAEGV